MARLSIGLVTTLEFFIGVLFALWSLYGVSAFFASLARRHFGEAILSVLLFLAAAFVSLLCFSAGVGLIRRSQRARFSSLVQGFFVGGLGLVCLWSATHPTDEYSRSESGFGVGLALVVLVVSFLWVVLLNLPQTRAEFKLT
ncbi:MAG: hypothetical protein JSS95_03635 [Acidobacteria bacterium]|nr:hypothetical protein [Acidobacteriota bacterium]